MINREVISNRSALDEFDWFNDYKDTIRWVENHAKIPEWNRRSLLEEMKECYEEWLADRNE